MRTPQLKSFPLVPLGIVLSILFIEHKLFSLGPVLFYVLPVFLGWFVFTVLYWVARFIEFLTPKRLKRLLKSFLNLVGSILEFLVDLDETNPTLYYMLYPFIFGIGFVSIHTLVIIHYYYY